MAPPKTPAIQIGPDSSQIIKSSSCNARSIPSKVVNFVPAETVFTFILFPFILLASKAYNLIGLNFDEFSDPQKAIDFYKKGIQMALRTDNDTIKSWLYNNLGNVYCYRKIDFLKGIANYREGIKYSEKMNDAQEIVFSKLNIGSAYFSIQEFDKGIVYLKPIEHYIDKEGSIEAKISLNSNFVFPTKDRTLSQLKSA